MILRILSLIFLLIPTTVLSDVGFKDLKIGSDSYVIEENCTEIGEIFKCYDIDDLKFNFSSSNSKVVSVDRYKGIVLGNHISSISPFCNTLFGSKGRSDFDSSWKCYGKFRVFTKKDDQKRIVSIGVQTNQIDKISIDVGPLYQSLLDRVIGDPKNPYLKLKNSLDSKYQMEWEFTERDRKLFNEGEKNNLWTSYNEGQIFLEIMREDKYSVLRLYLHYHTKEDGERLSEDRKPQNVNFNDF